MITDKRLAKALFDEFITGQMNPASDAWHRHRRRQAKRFPKRGRGYAVDADLAQQILGRLEKHNI